MYNYLNLNMFHIFPMIKNKTVAKEGLKIQMAFSNEFIHANKRKNSIFKKIDTKLQI